MLSPFKIYSPVTYAYTVQYCSLESQCCALDPQNYWTSVPFHQPLIYPHMAALGNHKFSLCLDGGAWWAAVHGVAEGRT